MKPPRLTQDMLEQELMKKSPALAVASRILHEADKATSSFADAFVAQTYIEGNKMHGRMRKEVEAVMARYRRDMVSAHRFALDNTFTEMATALAITPAEKTLARVQYATLPYETTWIEFNLHAKMRLIQRIRGRDKYDLRNVSPVCGCLLQRINDVESVCTLITEIEGTPTVHTACYFFSTTPVDFTGRNTTYHGCVPTKNNSYMWGYGDSKEDHSFTPSFLKRHGTLGFSRFHGALSHEQGIHDKIARLAINEVREFSGHMRWLVTVLAMLNEVPVHSEPVHRVGHMRVGTFKKHNYMDYHRVTLRLPKTNPIKYYERQLNHSEIRHRAHEVRAHWRTYLHERHCRIDEHSWEYDHEHGYRLCGKCMAFSRLIHEHVRGNAELGWVRKDYVIKKETR